MIKIIILFIVGLFFTNGYKSDPKLYITPAPTMMPTILPTPILLPEPTKIPTSWLIYPNAVILNQNIDTINLKSEDNFNIITEYYKNLFTNNGSKSRSFVTTNANGNILNKLSGIVKRKTLNIEIKKDNGSSTVYINITY